MVKPEPISPRGIDVVTPSSANSSAIPASAAIASAPIKSGGVVSGNGTGAVGNVASSKDPSRPRRKKARRACFACQRAHLTCGELPPGCLVGDWVWGRGFLKKTLLGWSVCRRRTALPEVHQARSTRRLSRWGSKEGKVSPRRPDRRRPAGICIATVKQCPSVFVPPPASAPCPIAKHRGYAPSRRDDQP